MAQQQAKKAELAFKDVSLQAKATWKKGLAIPLVFTVLDTRTNEVVDGKDVNLWRKGEKTLLTSTEGKVSYDIPIDGPGNWPIEIEMFDDQGQRIALRRTIIVVEEKHEEKKKDLYLYVQAIRHDGFYDILVGFIDENEKPVKKEGTARILDTLKETPEKVEFENGVAHMRIEFPLKETHVHVFCDGQTKFVTLYPAD